MRKIFLVLFTLISVAALAQEKKAPLSPAISSESQNVKITYGQPSKKGRVIFGELVPYDKIWRTGANNATEVTFKKDVDFGGAKVKAGTYSLFTVPNENEWVVILNSELKQWGSYSYDKIKGSNSAEVKVPVKKLSSPEEKLQINTDDKTISIAWDNVQVSVPLKF